MLAVAANLPAESARRSPFLRSLRQRPEWLLSPLVLAALLGGWEAVVAFHWVNEYVLPPPSAVFGALVEALVEGDMLEHTFVTCREALTGFAIAVVAGIVVGGALAQSALLERTVYFYLVAIQTMPKIALAPLFIAWFGFGMASKVAVAALIAFFPMLVNVIVGLKSCDSGKIDVMRALSASEWQIFRLVKLPNALPFVFAGLNVAIIFALTGAIVGEFVGAREGLGYQMMLANSSMDIPQVFAALILLGIIGLLFYVGIGLLERRLLFWTASADHGRNSLGSS